MPTLFLQVRRAASFAGLALLGLSSVLACKRQEEEPERGAAPPPLPTAKPGACASGGGTANDAVASAFFPRTAGSYCIDPNGETRSYGENASGSLDKVCTELFDGECEVYKSYGLKRVVTLRYIDGEGSPGAVNVNLSKFGDKAQAYGFFTKRVVADGDPAESAPTPLEAGGAAALGTGIAYVWRGDYVAELSYTNDVETPDQLKQTSRRVLPMVAKPLGEKLPGDTEPPPAVRLLPDEHRIPSGISFDPEDVLDIGGLGPGAVGYYKNGDKRWRVLAIVRPDEAAAGDVMRTLKKAQGAEPVKSGPVAEASRFSVKDQETGPKTDWVVSRFGSRILGVGDETFGRADGAPASTTDAEKLDRLKTALEAAQARPTPAGAASGPNAGSPGAAPAGSVQAPPAVKPPTSAP